MKFSQKVVLSSSALMIVTIFLLSLLQGNITKGAIESIITSSLSEMVAGVRSNVIAEMQSRRGLAQATTEIIELDGNNRDYVKQIIERPKLRASALAIGLGYDSDGSVVENDPNWDPPSTYDPRKRPWYQDAKSSRKLIVTDPYVDATSGKMIISVGTPVYTDGNFIGAMYYDVSLAGLADLVNKANLFDAGYLFIVTNKGSTLAHPDESFNGKPYTDYLPAVQLKEGFQSVEIDGVPYLINLTAVESEQWFVGAVVDEDKAFSTLASLRNNSIIFTVVAVVIGVIVLMLLIRRLMAPLQSLNTAIEGVASGDGDLTQRLDTDIDPEFAQLTTGFNQFTESLRTKIHRSKELSEQVLAGVEQIVENSDLSTSELNKQVEELEQLATAMNEMSATATDVASSAETAANAAKEADAATNDGNKVVESSQVSIQELSDMIDQAVEQVKGLELATTNIETVLSVINEIAEQTNLLALNAAIEAARAGDSGRGFAVVADEVRTLAQRTQQSTTEIRTMIEQLQSGSSLVSKAMNDSKDKAVQVVSESQVASESLAQISTAIERITDMNMQIASAAEEQSLVAEEINSNTVKIKDISSHVNEIAVTSNEVTQSQAEKVREQEALMSQFKV